MVGSSTGYRGGCVPRFTGLLVSRWAITDAFMQIGVSALIGIIAGVLIWFAERPQTTNIEEEAIAGSEAFRASLLDHGTVLTRLAALLVLAICWVPFLGFVFGSFAAIANRGVYGWPSRVSNWAALLGVFSTGAFIVLMLKQTH